MPLMLYFVTSGAFLFGYAKPVPVNFGKLENPKRNMIWVALAGPAANLVQAFIWACALIFLRGLDITEYFFLKMCEAGILVNLVMFAFNLFPLPPPRWWADHGGPTTIPIGRTFFEKRTLGLLHRYGVSGLWHSGRLVDASLDELHVIEPERLAHSINLDI